MQGKNFVLILIESFFIFTLGGTLFVMLFIFMSKIPEPIVPLFIIDKVEILLPGFFDLRGIIIGFVLALLYSIFKFSTDV
ncbi:MAG: hypothetical protein KJ646_02260 [Nanoarchaeota archaeon]|nr:hypothetical protein [Nanoarchaeota archaeon]MBU4116420.1 hypothetical protein [Nanoarchaeota archaeon]